MSESDAILLALKCGIKVVVGSRPDPKRNMLSSEALMKLIEELKK